MQCVLVFFFIEAADGYAFPFNLKTCVVAEGCVLVGELVVGREGCVVRVSIVSVASVSAQHSSFK